MIAKPRTFRRHPGESRGPEHAAVLDAGFRRHDDLSSLFWFLHDLIFHLALFHISEILPDEIFREGGILLNLRPLPGQGFMIGAQAHELPFNPAPLPRTADEIAKALVGKEKERPRKERQSKYPMLVFHNVIASNDVIARSIATKQSVMPFEMTDRHGRLRRPRDDGESVTN